SPCLFSSYETFALSDPSPWPVRAQRISDRFSFSFHQASAMHPNSPPRALLFRPVATAADALPVADDAPLSPVADDAPLDPVADDAHLSPVADDAPLYPVADDAPLDA